MPDLLTILNAKLAALQAEKARITADAQANVASLTSQINTIQSIITFATNTPQVEVTLKQLHAAGVLDDIDRNLS